MRILLPTACLLLGDIALATPARTQPVDPLTAPYPPSLCPSCAEWNEPHRPFQIHGSTYYVGTSGLGSILIASPAGHVLIDGGLPASAPLIIENIRSLGFDVADVRLILNSHSHYDHAGGIAALQRASGARVAASEASATSLEAGGGQPGDPQYGALLGFPAVSLVERFDEGGSLSVGEISLMAHPTEGHSPGGTTWVWQSCEGEDCVWVVYADSQTPVSAESFRFSGNRSAVAAFERGFTVLETIPCDILVTPHPGAAQLWERWETGLSGLIDPDACRRYAADGRSRLAERLRAEAAGP